MVRRIEEIYDEELARAGVAPTARGPQAAPAFPRPMPADRGARELPPL
jgi:hypothetical protein